MSSFWDKLKPRKEDSNSPGSKECGKFSKGAEIDVLQEQVRLLREKCGRLEAQNVLIPVQQLDLLAQTIAFMTASLSILLFWKTVSYGVDRAQGIFGQSAIIDLIAAKTRLLGNDRIQTFILQSEDLVNTFLWSSIKYILCVVPVWSQYRSGLAYRRFQVFAIFFIILARTRLCRWRESVFLSESPTDGAETSIEHSKDNEDDTTVPAYGSNITHDDIWESNYEISARFLYVSIFRVQGLWIKTAQYLSSRADFMPVPYVRELAKLQDCAPQTPWEQARQMIPKSILTSLLDLNETALASASIGQVHTATWNGEGKVVVKVQHPKARPLLLDDFRSLHIICRIVRWLEPEYGFMEVLMREWAKEAKKELDFEKEAVNLKDAARSIEKWGEKRLFLTNSHEGNNRRLPFSVEIPVPLVATKHVLVMTYSEGVRVDNIEQLKKWNIPTAAVMDAVAQTFAHLMYVCPPFNGDPHPGNLFIRPGTTSSDDDGFTLVLLDWGLSKKLEDDKRKAFCQMALAAATFDYGLLLDSFQTIGLQMKREDVAEDMEGIRFLLRDISPSKVSRSRIKAKIQTDKKRFSSREKGKRLPMESKAYPGEFFFFVRVNELVHGLGAKYGINLSFVDILRPFAERGLSDLLASKYRLYSSPPEIQSTDTVLGKNVRGILTQLQHDIAGAQVCVLNSNGDTLVNEVAGNSGSLIKGIAMRPDSLVLGYSCTKAVAATMAHIMVGEGYLSFDEPLSERVWTRFCPSETPPILLEKALGISRSELERRWSWKRQISLRHVLTHVAGFWSALPVKLTVQMVASCEKCVAAFEFDQQSPETTLLPSNRPGGQGQYHFMSFGWLVAGALTGAYAAKHGLHSSSVTFETVYEAVLVPKLSPETKKAGFRPCGRSGGFPIAYTETDDLDIPKRLQKLREMEAQGEGSTILLEGLRHIRDQFRGKEFLLDPRIWNCDVGLNANCPSAAGRFTAEGLARFYLDLGTGRLIAQDALDLATSVVDQKFPGNPLQGRTQMSEININRGPALAMGYQLISFSQDAQAFGHVGVGGSIGFYHPSGFAVSVMLNKADAPVGTAAKIIRVIASALEW